jgi:SAM-dependent methyltransferase
MTFYERRILPWLLDMAMSAKPITWQRRKVVPLAEGRVLEIGLGAGQNLQFYDPVRVSHVWGLEPSAEMRERATHRAKDVRFSLEFLDLKDYPALRETAVEQAIIDNLQAFLLELGKGFSFVARQKRLRFEDDDFYLDLVFYNYLLKCFLFDRPQVRQADASGHRPDGHLCARVRCPRPHRG